MRWTPLLPIAFVVSSLSTPVALPSAKPPHSVAKEAGVSVTCQLRKGGTTFLLDATLSPKGSGMIVDGDGKVLSGVLSDYWKIELDPVDRDGNCAARIWRKGEDEPFAAVVKAHLKSGKGAEPVLHGYDKDKKPQTVPLASCSELRIRE